MVPVVSALEGFHCRWRHGSSVSCTPTGIRKPRTAVLGKRLVGTLAEDMNEEMEASEQNKKKDECNIRREAYSQGIQHGLSYCVHMCHLVGQSKAGLVNHVWQKHSRAAKCRL